MVVGAQALHVVPVVSVATFGQRHDVVDFIHDSMASGPFAHGVGSPVGVDAAGHASVVVAADVG